ncbi:MAG: hypothetical protein HXY34_11010 [Candidatus Thorarchaeota archaeon]|nr:hypothetical protein [Candidatus Thorarchaeota archaeon]
MSDIDEIVGVLHRFDGITRKYVLPAIIGRLRKESYAGVSEHTLGEDSAAIEGGSADTVLLTTDSIVEELCVAHPRAAGFNVVLACVMDIYAAGGIPTSFAVALSYSSPSIGEEMLRGLIEASHTFRVPIVRGHTNPQSRSTYVVGSATGRVRKKDLLTAGGARPGDSLVLIFDPAGQRGVHYRLGWDSVTGRSADVIGLRLSTMNALAKAHLLSASKDVSVAGLIGTSGMMLEYSGVGGLVDLDSVNASRPIPIPLIDWIRMYLSLGFLVSVSQGRIEQVTKCVNKHGMRAVCIGSVDDSSSLRVSYQGEERVVFDFERGPVLTPR